MAEFQLIWFEGKDLEHAGQIIKNVAGVSSLDGAVKWALEQCATKWRETEPRDAAPVASSSEQGVGSVPLPDAIEMPLGVHTCEVIKMKNLAQLEHTVVIASATLERLVPDNEMRLTLFRDDVI